MTRIITVDYLEDLLKKLQEQGYGNMRIKCKDGFVHEGEIFVNHSENEMMFDGCVFNIDSWERVRRFREEVDRAWKDFNNSMIREQEAEVQP